MAGGEQYAVAMGPPQGGRNRVGRPARMPLQKRARLVLPFPVRQSACGINKHTAQSHQWSRKVQDSRLFLDQPIKPARG